ncbi:hypothetical protein DPMN_135994 [Dreissena polymorpha]|uniref:Carbohydrate sulfotransferase n=1 Tax=Dreissena polymorpha TaxID=45954 RepID=A0A9D4G040_DREPO|nr:hypothetical protein DPMN_135994 [Dreissena polymorpha]
MGFRSFRERRVCKIQCRNMCLCAALASCMLYATFSAYFQETVISSGNNIEAEVVYHLPAIKNESMDTRLRRISEVCARTGAMTLISTAPFDITKRMFLNRTGICTCIVPKAASTNVKRLLLSFEYPEKAELFRKMPGNMIHAANFDEGTTCSDRISFSFLISRDPYQRLWSAYVDKVFLEKFDSLAIMLDTVFVRNVKKSSLQMNGMSHSLVAHARTNGFFCNVGHASFEHFLMYVTKTTSLDPHVLPVSLMCDPCKHPVNYVFQQENLQNDVKYLYKYVKTIFKNQTDVQISLSDYVGENGIENLVQTYQHAWKARLSQNQCKVDSATYDSIWKRLWEGLKYLGIIDEKLPFMPELFRGRGTILKSPEKIVRDFKLEDNAVVVLSADDWMKQRHKFIVNAYKGVRKSVLNRIRELFQLDFEMFGYSTEPPR